MKIKKTVILNKKKGIIPFIKSYFEARIQKKKTKREELRKQKVTLWKKAKEGRLIPKRVTKKETCSTHCLIRNHRFLVFLY